ncbi:MAG: hypothetical protein BMS9Abin07_0468 [Acidimicrobiia bacterium]|nr:MAG: hypothetical protein BMS9Abin07_0468 [Acidimicrobiia bacterium]
MNRTTAIVFGVAGVLALSGSALHAVSEPAYYDPSAFIDYLAVVSLTTIFVVTGVALVLLWRDPPVRRGSLFLLLAGIGAAAVGLGNLFEDAFDVEAAVWVFFGGGLLMLVSLPIAGIAALTVHSPRRWSGLFLLFAAPGAILGFGFVMMGVSWILFGLWIVYQHRAFVIAIAVAAVPALATVFYLYGDDVFFGV